MNITRIHGVLDRKRTQHPELRGKVGMRQLSAVVRREGIGIYTLPVPADGCAITIMGERAIILDPDLPARRRRETLAHELAHVWLHMPAAESGSRDWRRDSPREEFEADYLAALLFEGPCWEASR